MIANELLRPLAAPDARAARASLAMSLWGQWKIAGGEQCSPAHASAPAPGAGHVRWHLSGRGFHRTLVVALRGAESSVDVRALVALPKEVFVDPFQVEGSHVHNVTSTDVEVTCLAPGDMRVAHSRSQAASYSSAARPQLVLLHGRTDAEGSIDLRAPVHFRYAPASVDEALVSPVTLALCPVVWSVTDGAWREISLADDAVVTVTVNIPCGRLADAPWVWSLATLSAALGFAIIARSFR